MGPSPSEAGLAMQNPVRPLGAEVSWGPIWPHRAGSRQPDLSMQGWAKVMQGLIWPYAALLAYCTGEPKPFSAFVYIMVAPLQSGWGPHTALVTGPGLHTLWVACHGGCTPQDLPRPMHLPILQPPSYESSLKLSPSPFSLATAWAVQTHSHEGSRLQGPFPLPACKIWATAAGAMWGVAAGQVPASHMFTFAGWVQSVGCQLDNPGLHILQTLCKLHSPMYVSIQSNTFLSASRIKIKSYTH